MANLERKGNLYRVVWRTGGRGSPRKVTPWRKGKAEALAVKARVEDRQAASRPPRMGAEESLATLVHAWSAAKVAEGNHATHTAASATRLLSLCERWGLLYPSDVTAATINDIRTGVRAPRATEKPEGYPARWRSDVKRWSPRAGALLRALLTWAADNRGAQVEAAALVALRPRERPRARKDLVDDTVVGKWLGRARSISPSCFALVHCLLLYGWRPITAARLRVRDVDLAGARLTTVVKSRAGTRPHVHALRADTVELLRPLMDGRPPDAELFTDPRTGEAFAETNCYGIPQWWRDYLGDLGGMAYDGKRFACTRILRDVSATEGRFITGHASARQLELYATTNDDRAREIVDALPALPPVCTECAPEASPVISADDSARESSEKSA